MAVGLRKAPRVFSCRTCGSVQSTWKRHEKNYCTLKCWYSRHTLPDGHRLCTLCKAAKPDKEFTKGVARCKACRNDATKAYVERLKKESYARFIAYRSLQGMASRAPLTDRESMRPLLEGMLSRALECGRCPYCNCAITETNCSLDHILPVSRGGTNTIGNLQVTCLRCNLMKGNIGHESFLSIKLFISGLCEDERKIVEARLLSGNSRFTRKKA